MRPGKKHSLLRLPMPFTEWLCPLSGQRLIYRDVYVVDHHGWESGIARGKDVRGSLRKVRSPLSIHEGLGQRLSRVLRPYTDDPPTILHRSGGHGKVRHRIPAALRRTVAERDADCQICGTADDLRFDHIIPRAFGGVAHEWNLWVLCTSCNQAKWHYLHPPALRIAIDRLSKALE
jgi:hypothetical protein